LGAGSNLYFDGPGQSVDNLNITPAGDPIIYASGPTSGGPQTLTLGNNVTVHGGVVFANYNAGDALINNGTINADGGYTSSINLDNFTNNNLAEATGGGTLNINSANWTNNGTLSATGGSTLNLGGNFTTAQIGTVTADATSTVNITGALDNSSATLAPAGGGTWYLNGGTITGGTIDQSAQPLYVQTGTLNGVAFTGGDVQVAAGGNLTVQNGLTITNHKLDVGAGATVDIMGSKVIINYTGADPLAYYQGLVLNGYAGGSWTGTTSITSSSVAAQNALTAPINTYGVAVADGKDGFVAGLVAGQLEIAPAILGDANLDRTVNFSDFSILAGNFGHTGADWDEGISSTPGRWTSATFPSWRGTSATFRNCRLRNWPTWRVLPGSLATLL